MPVIYADGPAECRMEAKARKRSGLLCSSMPETSEWRNNSNRIRYRAAGLLTVLLLSAVPGCADQALAEAAGTTETVAVADAVEIISRDFSHNGYVDSIAFLLPSGWSYESYEKIDAGENMDSHEWGFEICVDGEEEPSLFLFGEQAGGQRKVRSGWAESGSGTDGSWSDRKQIYQTDHAGKRRGQTGILCAF